MTATDTRDPIDDALAGLTPLAPNPSHAETVRRRCRARLARRAVSSNRRDLAGRSWAAVAVPLLLGIFSAFYAAALLSTTLHVEGWLR